MTPKEEKVNASQNYVWRKYVVPLIKEKSDNVCKDCNSNKKLEIHHDSYTQQNINHLICLCKPCHKLRHQFKRVNEKEFIEVLNKFRNVDLSKFFCISIAATRRLRIAYNKKLQRIKLNSNHF